MNLDKLVNKAYRPTKAKKSLLRRIGGSISDIVSGTGRAIGKTTSGLGYAVKHPINSTYYAGKGALSGAGYIAGKTLDGICYTSGKIGQAGKFLGKGALNVGLGSGRKLNDYLITPLRNVSGKIGKKIGCVIPNPIKEIGRYAGRVAYTGCLSANFLNDGLEFLKASGTVLGYTKNYAKGLVTRRYTIGRLMDQLWDSYKTGFREGHWLGGENIAKVLFYAGLGLSGVYSLLLVSRFSIGSGAHIAKSLATTRLGKAVVPVGVEYFSKPVQWAGRMIGVPKDRLQREFDRNNVRYQMRRIENDDYFRSQITPHVLEAVIALKSYLGIVAGKWAFGLGAKTANYLARTSTSQRVRRLAGNAEGKLNWMKNAFGDWLSYTIAKNGMINAYSAHESIQNWMSPEYAKDHPMWGAFVSGNLIKYFRSGEFTDGIQHDWESLKHYIKSDGYGSTLKQDLVHGVEGVRDGLVGIVQAILNPAFVGKIYDTIKHCVDGSLIDDAKRAYHYVADGTVLKDGKEFVAEKTSNAAGDAYQVFSLFKHMAISNLGWLADKLHIDKTDKYALVITAGNDVVTYFSGIEWKNAQHIAVTELQKQGFSVVQLDYDDATKPNIEAAIKQMAEKIDWNDIGVEVLQTHGVQQPVMNPDGSHVYDAKGNIVYQSTAHLAGAPAGQDYLTEQDLRKYHAHYNSGFVLALMVPCQSGTLPNTSNEHVLVVSSSNTESAWTHKNGLDMMNKLLIRAGKNGGIASYSDIFDLVRLAKRTSLAHNSDMPANADPQWGFGGQKNGGASELATPTY